MPIYDYLCAACDHRADILHGIHDPGPLFCPSCGAAGSMRKQFSAPTIHFKGTGWAKKDRGAASRTRVGAKGAPGEGGSGRESSSDGGDKASSGDGSASSSSSDSSPSGPSSSGSGSSGSGSSSGSSESGSSSGSSGSGSSESGSPSGSSSSTDSSSSSASSSESPKPSTTD